MAIPFISLADTFDQWRTKTNINYAAVGDIEGLTTPVTTDVISALNDLNQNLLKDLIDDTTPELGGNLSLNSKDIEGVGNINITGNITGTIVVGGDLSGTVDNAQVSTNTAGVVGTSVGGDVSGTVGDIQIIPNVVGINELNVSDGTTGQVLSRNGSGNLAFIDVVSDPTTVSYTHLTLPTNREV